jgi:hypothetical protein
MHNSINERIGCTANGELLSATPVEEKFELFMREISFGYGGEVRVDCAAGAVSGAMLLKKRDWCASTTGAHRKLKLTAPTSFPQ